MDNPLKGVMDLEAEVDKACKEYDKKLEEFKNLLKKLTPKNPKVLAQVVQKTAIAIEKARVQILNDKQTVFQTEANLRFLREEIKKSRDEFFKIGVEIEKRSTLFMHMHDMNN